MRGRAEPTGVLDLSQPTRVWRGLSFRIGVGLVLTGLVAAAVLLSATRASRAVETRHTILRLELAMFRAGVESREVLRTRDMARTSTVATHLGEARRELTLLPRVERVALTQLLETYWSAWKDLVSAIVARGIDENRGAEGRLRRTVHAVEAVVAKGRAPRVQLHMLTARRAEKDYILRRKPKYVGKLHRAVDALMAEVGRARRLGPRARAEILTRSAEYRQHFDEFVTRLEDVEEAARRLARVRDQLTRELEAISLRETARARALTRLADGLLVYGTLFGWVLAIVMANGVLRPLHTIRGAASRLARGEADFRIEPRGGEELEAIARALNQAGEETQRRVAAQEAAAEAEVFARQVVESSNDGILVLNRDLRIQMTNRQFREQNPLWNESLYGESVLNLMNPEQRAASRIRLERALAGEITQSPDLPVVFDEQGEPVMWIMTTNVPLRERNGGIRGIVTTVADITERKNHEMELERARRRAEEADAAKSRFLDNISHEMRTPLSGILGTTELLDSSELNPHAAESFELIRTSAEKLLSLIDAVIGYSELDDETADISCSPCRPRSMLEGMKERFDRQAARAQAPIRLVVGFDGAVALPVREVDKVISQLLDNAISYAGGAPIDLCVDAASSPAEDDRAWLRFSVVDRGPGIASAVQDVLFRAFEQGDGSRSKLHGGLGIGLATAKRIATRLGGRIEFASEEGKGSVFSLLVPTQPVEEEAPSMQADQARAPRPRRALRVLIVEDNLVNQKVAARMLTQLGVDAEVAANGREAVDRLGQMDFDLVLMDLQMPVMDGLEATRQVRAGLPDHRQPRIVALTANARPSDEAACREAGMDGFLAKPVRRASLESLLETVCRDASPRDARTGSTM